jgi:hypothetical protein
MFRRVVVAALAATACAQCLPGWTYFDNADGFEVGPSCVMLVADPLGYKDMVKKCDELAPVRERVAECRATGAAAAAAEAGGDLTCCTVLWWFCQRMGGHPLTFAQAGFNTQTLGISKHAMLTLVSTLVSPSLGLVRLGAQQSSSTGTGVRVASCGRRSASRCVLW